MGRAVARLSAVLVILAASSVATAAPARAAQGVTVQITQLPGEFVAGDPPAPVRAEASRSHSSCIKMRWSLVLRAGGAAPARVQVRRIEQERSFPVTVERAADAVRFTDRQLDPGRLCEGRKVTAQYEISFPADVTADAADVTPDAALSLAVEARSTGGRLLDRTTVTRQLRPVETSPSPAPAAGAATPEPSGAAGARLDAKRTNGASVMRIGPIGLAVGVVMVLVGLTLLVRVRRRSRRLRHAGNPIPQGPGWARSTSTLPRLRR